MNYKQQLHTNCKGSIMLVGNGDTYALACNKCQMLWDIIPPLMRSPALVSHNPDFTAFDAIEVD